MEKSKEILTIAFDTSCDDTSVAVLKGRKVLSSCLTSQIELHAEYGGVVPMIARRAHEENIQRVYEDALRKAKVEIEDIDYIVATYGPGLAIDLEVGLKFAQGLAIHLKEVCSMMPNLEFLKQTPLNTFSSVSQYLMYVRFPHLPF